MNFAYERIPLAIEDYKALVVGSKRYNIALNKFVLAFIVKTPLKREDLSLIFDSVYRYQNLEALIGRFTSVRTQYIETIPVRGKFHKNDIVRYDYTICNEDVENEMKELISFKEDKIIRPNEANRRILSEIKVELLGFYDEFKSNETKIEGHFKESKTGSEKKINAITGDIVRMNGESASFLKSIKNRESERLTQIENVEKEVSEILQQIDSCFKNVEKDFQDSYDGFKKVPKRVFDTIFETLFAGTRNGIDTGEYCLSRLTLLKYNDCRLVEAYLNHNSQIEYKTIKPDEWEKAKMYLELADLEMLPNNLVKMYLDTIKKSHIDTGKEYYALSLCQEAHNRVKTLVESLKLGYEPAGTALLKLYESDPDGSGVNLRTLSNALIPEACMMMADQDVNSHVGYNRVGITSSKLTYYKIAATKEYLPAIGAIVDQIYESRFSDGVKFSDYGQLNRWDVKKANNGHIICGLCRYLIEKEYQVKHYREILGVVLFSLKENPSEAMEALGGIDTGIANYCKGYMYENGIGTSRDLDKAISHYERAERENFDMAETYLFECRQKKKTEEIKSYNKYKSYETYTPTYTYDDDSSDSFCFISTAACKALKSSDDCEELETMRRFRDQYVESSTNGEVLVQEYYRIAPLIVEKIDQQENANETYKYLWNNFIQPSYELIQTKKYSEATLVYINMVKELCEQFKIDLRPHIMDIWNSARAQ